MKGALAPLAGVGLGLVLASCGGPDALRVQPTEQPNALSSTTVVRPQLPPRNNKPVIEGLTRQQTVRGEAQKFLQALGYSNQAAYLATQQPGLYSNPKLEKIIALRRMALETAKSVDIEILDSIVAGFGSHFRDDFIRGVTLFLEAVQSSSSDELLGRSREALNRWADWYDANRERIEVAVNAE
jgi:hypothetical protein